MSGEGRVEFARLSPEEALEGRAWGAPPLPTQSSVPKAERAAGSAASFRFEISTGKTVWNGPML